MKDGRTELSRTAKSTGLIPDRVRACRGPVYTTASVAHCSLGRHHQPGRDDVLAVANPAAWPDGPYPIYRVSVSDWRQRVIQYSARLEIR